MQHLDHLLHKAALRILRVDLEKLSHGVIVTGEPAPLQDGINVLYALIARDAPDSLQRRRAVRERHLARIQQLVDQGRLIVAGPHPAIDAEDPGEAGFTGSLIIAEFASREAAREWIDADPYVTEGVFESIEIKPFRQVMP